jgi:hypothetical protein
MIRFPNRLAGMMPSRTHRHTVATDTSSSFATSLVVMYLFVIFVMLMNLTSAIYTSGESGAPGAACEFVALRLGRSGGGVQDVSISKFLFPNCFHFVDEVKWLYSNGF